MNSSICASTKADLQCKVPLKTRWLVRIIVAAAFVALAGCSLFAGEHQAAIYRSPLPDADAELADALRDAGYHVTQVDDRALCDADHLTTATYDLLVLPDGPGNDQRAMHVEVEVTWAVYQQMIAAYREPDRAVGRELMRTLIESLSHGVPTALTEIATLGRTLKRRAADVLAYFDRPGTSNGPTEAINGRLEHLRGSALGFRNLTNYIARSLLETGGFRPQLHPGL